MLARSTLSDPHMRHGGICARPRGPLCLTIVWNIARKRSIRNNTSTSIPNPRAALARPHPPMLELTRPLGPLHQQPANLVRAGEQVVAAFGSTSFTGRRTLLHRRASGFLLPLGRGRRGSRVNARRALARGHVRLRQLHSTNTALRSPYLAARCFACLA